jgi:hypothetical protein
MCRAFDRIKWYSLQGNKAIPDVETKPSIITGAALHGRQIKTLANWRAVSKKMPKE